MMSVVMVMPAVTVIVIVATVVMMIVYVRLAQWATPG